LIAIAGREGFDGYLPVLVEDHPPQRGGTERAVPGGRARR
jgi:hypothetical protein